MKNCVTFASQLRVAALRAFSSAGLEHLPYKQRVGGSNPSTPTEEVACVSRFFLFTTDAYRNVCNGLLSLQARAF